MTPVYARMVACFKTWSRGGSIPQQVQKLKGMKKYDKLFRERFGVEPFTDEELFELKAMVYASSSDGRCGTSTLYTRYDTIFSLYLAQIREKLGEELLEKDYISYLEEKGYRVTK